MPDDTSTQFHRLMAAVLAGDADATATFCRDYQFYILEAVRQRLMRRMRSLYDSRDFVNDVWASFFANPPHRLEFESPDKVVAYLEHMARQKVGRATHDRCRRKRDLDREQPLPEHLDSHADPLPGNDPTPSRIASAREQWQRLLADRPRHEQAMIHYLSEGLTHREIATLLNTTEKTVQRLVRRIQNTRV